MAARTREQDILTWEFARPGLRALVRTAAIGGVLWAPDGTVLYSLSRDGRTAIYRQNADGTGQPSKVVESERSLVPQAMVPDRSALVVGHGDEIALVRLNADPRIETLVAGATNASLSPNGAWLAYASSESREVFVRPFPRVNDGAWPVSSGPGSAPLWSRSGRELFYIAQGDLMSAAIEDGPSFRFRTPTRLLSVRDYAPSGLGRGFDVAKDGRFLMLKPVGRADPVINVVYNWFGEVARVKPR